MIPSTTDNIIILAYVDHSHCSVQFFQNMHKELNTAVRVVAWVSRLRSLRAPPQNNTKNRGSSSCSYIYTGRIHAIRQVAQSIVNP
jgi:hypothetical protein